MLNTLKIAAALLALSAGAVAAMENTDTPLTAGEMQAFQICVGACASEEIVERGTGSGPNAAHIRRIRASHRRN